MGAYVQSPNNPSLLRDYETTKKRLSAESGDTPKREANETEDQYAERLRRHSVLTKVLDQV